MMRIMRVLVKWQLLRRLDAPRGGEYFENPRLFNRRIGFHYLRSLSNFGLNFIDIYLASDIKFRLCDIYNPYVVIV